MSKYDRSDNYKLVRWFEVANGYGNVKQVAVYIVMAAANDLALRAANNKRQLATAGPVICKVNG